jgi:hypothetical protein
MKNNRAYRAKEMKKMAHSGGIIMARWKRTCAVLLLTVLWTAGVSWAAITLTSAQKRSIAQGRGDKEATVTAVLKAAGVDATDSAEISAAVEEIMFEVATEYEVDPGVVQAAAEGIAEAAIRYAVEEGNPSYSEVAEVAKAVAAAITKTVVEVAADLKVSTSKTAYAVRAASVGTILGTILGADFEISDAGADLDEVAGAVAAGNVEGAAQGAENTNTDIRVVAEAAFEGNIFGAEDQAVTAAVLYSSEDAVNKVTAPKIRSVSSPARDGAYGAGQSIDITVTFNRAVEVVQKPVLKLKDVGDAVYESGSGTAVLTFEYVVQAGHNVALLACESKTALVLKTGEKIGVKDGPDANLELPEPGQDNSLSKSKNVVIDTTPPTVATISFDPAQGPYAPGADVTVLATFSEGMSPTALPKAAFSRGETILEKKDMAPKAGSGNIEFTCEYKIPEGTGDIEVTVSGGEDLAGNKMVAQKTENIGVTKLAKVTSVSPGKNVEVYNKAGDEIDIEVTFDKPVTVTVTGTDKPVLRLKGVGEAVYESGSESETLVFRYEVGDNDNASPLSCDGPGALDKKGAEIKGADGLDADSALPASEADKPLKVGDENLVIDTTPPTVATISFDPAQGPYAPGTDVTVLATFSEGMSPTALPKAAFSREGQELDAKDMVLKAGSDKNEFTYEYKIPEGTGDIDVKVSGGEDLAGNKMVAQMTENIEVTKLAKVTSVSPGKNVGVYNKAGDEIDIEVTFDKPVTVTGTDKPVLKLKGVGEAVYESGSESETLVFRYEVGDNDNASPCPATAQARWTRRGRRSRARTARVRIRRCRLQRRKSL